MPDGGRVDISDSYRKLVRPKKLVLSWRGDYNETIITLTFEAEGAGTMMTPWQVGFLDCIPRGGCENSWTGTGDPFDKRA